MKRAVWTILGSMAILACSDSVVGPEEAIIGSWRTTQNGQTVTWTFRNGGSLRVSSETDEVGNSSFTTRYAIDGDTVSIQAFNGIDDQGKAVDFPAGNCQVVINDRSLRMSCDIGVVNFTRVGPGSEDNAV